MEDLKEFRVKNYFDPQNAKAYVNLYSHPDGEERSAAALREELVQQLIAAIEEGRQGIVVDFSAVIGYGPEIFMSVAFDDFEVSLRDSLEEEPELVKVRGKEILDRGLAEYIVVKAENELNHGDILARITSRVFPMPA